MRDGPEIFVSILDCNVLEIQREIDRVAEAGVRRIHLDIADGSFVDSISLGEAAANRIVRANKEMEFECHLMVRNPLKVIANLDVELMGTVIIHNESVQKNEAAKEVRRRGSRLGIAISPGESLAEMCVGVDGRDMYKLLVMGVHPGRGGQEMLGGMEQRIRECRALARRIEQGAGIAQGRVKIGVDGGVNLATIERAKGCDHFVVGSSFFRSADPKGLVAALKAKLGQ